MAAGGFIAYLVWPAAVPPQPAAPLSILPGDLCRRVFDSREFGYRVRVPFLIPLTPTADPFVWELRPGYPSERVAPTIRLHFLEPPTLPKLATVIGTVSRIEPDDRPRKSRHLGVVVLTDCTLEPAAP